MGGSLSKSIIHLSGQKSITESWILLILEFLPMKTRFQLMYLTRGFYQSLRTQEFFRWLCGRLSLEYGVYIPVEFLSGNWIDIFWQNAKLRDIWTLRELGQEDRRQIITSQSKINVYAKFRPLSLDSNAFNTSNSGKQNPLREPQLVNEPDSTEVTLPLHQRLSMIKMSHNITNNREALRILASEGGWFADKWTALSKRTDEDLLNSLDSENRSESIRNRRNYNPMESGVKAEKLIAKVQTIDQSNGKIVVVAPDVGLREFTFDGVLSPTASQQLTYDVTGRKLVSDLINGFNATALVYGQTSSGKTYTMFGPDEVDHETDSGTGLVSRACTEIFNAIKARRSACDIDAEVAISYVEVFGDRISDLLKGGSRCGHSKAAAQQFVLQGAAERPVSNLKEVRAALAIGEEFKRRAATAMNDRSTRAHNIFILSLRQTNLRTGVTRSSKLFLADLGGSEQVKKSLATNENQKDVAPLPNIEWGDRLREAVYINLGLLALKKCIEALNTGAAYIPYQDSKLTMLLSSGLGGNSKTSIIVCSRLEAAHLAETVATLRFGEKCALVSNQISSEDMMLANILKALDAEIKELEAKIVAKERWEMVVESREDILAEEGTLEKSNAFERRTVTRLVGAEKERRELEQLLKRRAQFVGVNPLELEKKNVLGFGKDQAEVYGIGKGFSESEEEVRDNERFTDAVSKELLPSTVRKEWVGGSALAADPKVLETKANTIKRTKLKFAGLSL